MKKIFIDGQAGTTGLRIHDRLKERKDIELLTIDLDKRKDSLERKKLINESDITFLCLHDDVARESVSFVENENTVIIDTSTAHRTNSNWIYGFPELSKENREKIKNSKRIANTGCHAVGFISIVNPLIRTGTIKADYPFVSHSITGYSGGGNKMIDDYENKNRDDILKNPRQYALGLSHKHLPEMKMYSGISYNPIFNPILGDFYSGMAVSIPLHTRFLNVRTKMEVYNILKDYYKDEKFINVEVDETKIFKDGIINPAVMKNRDDMLILVYGNDNEMEIVSLFDNLGKGASGSAIQSMNIVLGIDESTGLNLE